MAEETNAPPRATTPERKPTQTPNEEASKFGRFILRYHTFLSSFVVGLAGLIATSIWQYRQSETTRKQAEAQQKVVETQAANSWKIERAEILGKNLPMLTATGPGSADQRYGVLLSLTRGNILDPELAVSYALELGKDNPEYMVSVLANTPEIDFARLMRAFTLSCDERYGTAPLIEACDDKNQGRSDALAEFVAGEVALAVAQRTEAQPPTPPATEPLPPVEAPPPRGPLALLADERQVQHHVHTLVGLFQHAITEMYERRQWDELNKFLSFSNGAHVVGSLVLAAARTGEFVTEEEAKTLEGFHATHTRWMAEYLLGKSCETDCKGRIVEVMASHYMESRGDYDAALRQLLDSPLALSRTAISKLHARLLWCQIDAEDLAGMRDHVFLPALAEAIKSGVSATVQEGIVSLLAITPAPAADDESQAEALKAWQAALSKLEKQAPRLFTLYKQRRSAAIAQRKAPPYAIKKLNFCEANPTLELTL